MSTAGNKKSSPDGTAFSLADSIQTPFPGKANLYHAGNNARNIYGFCFEESNKTEKSCLIVSRRITLAATNRMYHFIASFEVTVDNSPFDPGLVGIRQPISYFDLPAASAFLEDLVSQSFPYLQSIDIEIRSIDHVSADEYNDRRDQFTEVPVGYLSLKW